MRFELTFNAWKCILSGEEGGGDDQEGHHSASAASTSKSKSDLEKKI